MADSGFFKGTSADQDRRFTDKEKKLLKSLKFPPEFDKKVLSNEALNNCIQPNSVTGRLEEGEPHTHQAMDCQKGTASSPIQLCPSLTV